MSISAVAPIEVRVQPSLMDQYRLVRDHMGSVSSRWIGWVLFLGLPVLMVLLNLRAGRTLHDSIMNNLFWVLFGPVFLFVGMPLIWVVSLAWSRRANPRMAAEQIYRFSDSGLQLTTGFGEISVPWANVVRVRETPHTVLFFVGTHLAHTILAQPLHDAGVMDALRALVNRQVPGRREWRG